MRYGKDMVDSDPSKAAVNHKNRRPNRTVAAILAATLTLVACTDTASKSSAKETATTITANQQEKLQDNLDAKVEDGVAQLSKHLIDMYDSKKAIEKVVLAEDDDYETITVKYAVPNHMFSGAVGRRTFSVTTRRDSQGNLDPYAVKELSFSTDIVDTIDEESAWPVASAVLNKEPGSNHWAITTQYNYNGLVYMPVERNTAYPNGLKNRYSPIDGNSVTFIVDFFNGAMHNANVGESVPTPTAWEF